MLAVSRSEFHLRLFRWLFCVVVLVRGVTPSLPQSSARPSPAQVIAPKPPTPVTIEGKQVLVYELHITDYGPSALTLTRIQVFGKLAVDYSPVPKSDVGLADYSGKDLTKLLEPVGAADPTNLGHLEVGKLIIAFMYVALPQDSSLFALRHRFSFDVADPSRAKGTPNDETALDGVVVPVLRQAPSILRPPLGDGVWLAGNGPANDSIHRRAVIALDGRAFISQRFAADWMMVGPNGNTFHDGRARNENFWGFGQPVLAVADGEVTEVVDGIPDHLPDHPPDVTLRTIAGNHVIVCIAPGVYAMFAHLKPGSIRVRLHQQVKSGEALAELGDSGNTTAPHLHFQLMDANSALAAEGIPYVFENFRFLGFGKEFEMDKHPDQLRSFSLPMDDTVLRFY
jgi:hypothetical protein